MFGDQKISALRAIVDHMKGGSCTELLVSARCKIYTMNAVRHDRTFRLKEDVVPVRTELRTSKS